MSAQLWIQMRHGRVRLRTMVHGIHTTLATDGMFLKTQYLYFFPLRTVAPFARKIQIQLWEQSIFIFILLEKENVVNA